MKIPAAFLFFVMFLLFSFTARDLYATQYEDGRAKLVINDNNGSFSLYYMTDVDRRLYEPLWWDRDPKTSFIGVYLDGREYRLGDSLRFKMYHRGTPTKPTLVFESPMIAVTLEFSFIRTASSGVSNGIRVDIRIENWSEQTVDAGARMLIDTYLGELANPNFRTDLRSINHELMIDRSSRDQWWVSRNSSYGAMGSVFVEGIDPPSQLHFANWKRLYRATFRPEYVPSRNFSEMPFSIRDSAVCYYLEPQKIDRWQSRAFTVLLAAEDKYGFEIHKDTPVIIERVYEAQKIEVQEAEEPPKEPEKTENPGLVFQQQLQTSTQQQQQQPARGRRAIVAPINSMRLDILTLRELINKVDGYIYYGTPVSEEELRAMEAVIIRLKSLYGGYIGPYTNPYPGPYPYQNPYPPSYQTPYPAPYQAPYPNPYPYYAPGQAPR